MEQKPSGHVLSEHRFLYQLMRKYQAINEMRMHIYTDSARKLYTGQTEHLAHMGTMRVTLETEIDLINLFMPVIQHFDVLSAFAKDRILSDYFVRHNVMLRAIQTRNRGGRNKERIEIPDGSVLHLNLGYLRRIYSVGDFDGDFVANLIYRYFLYEIQLSGNRIAENGLDDTELAALQCLLIFDSTIVNECAATAEVIKLSRNQLFRDLVDYYKLTDADPAIRRSGSAI